MNSDSDDYAIKKDLKLLNNKNNNSFLLLTKYIIDMQIQNRFNLLNIQSDQQNDNIFNSPIVKLDAEKYYIISQIYKQYNIFNEVKKYITKTTKIKKLSPIINNLLESIDEKITVKNFLNIIILVNLIKKQLKNKLNTDINNYDLQNKLNKIHPNLMSAKLSLHSIETYTTKEQMHQFIESYTYQTVNMSYLLTITDEDYDKIYNEFFLFK
jgi:hypothetical protein